MLVVPTPKSCKPKLFVKRIFPLQTLITGSVSHIISHEEKPLPQWQNIWNGSQYTIGAIMKNHFDSKWFEGTRYTKPKCLSVSY